MNDEIAAHHRMRRSLLSIRDLDPVSVDRRLGEMDAAIERLQAAMASDADAPRVFTPRDAAVATVRAA